MDTVNAPGHRRPRADMGFSYFEMCFAYNNKRIQRRTSKKSPMNSRRAFRPFGVDRARLWISVSKGRRNYSGTVACSLIGVLVDEPNTYYDG